MQQIVIDLNRGGGGYGVSRIGRRQNEKKYISADFRLKWFRLSVIETQIKQLRRRFLRKMMTQTTPIH